MSAPAAPRRTDPSRGAAALGVTLLLGAFAMPLYWMVVASLTEEALLFSEPSLFPADPTTEHYAALFATRAFVTPILNSLVVAGLTTVLCVGLGSLCAYAVARMHFPGKSVVLALVLAVSMFPQVAIISPLYLVLRALGLIDTYAGLVLPYLTFAMPLTIWLLVGFFRQLPPDIEEAALVDGASRVRVLVDVVAPLSLPGIATTAILTFLYSWNEFLFALSFTVGPDHQTVPVAIALLRGRYQIPWGEILAASVVASVPVALLVLFLQRRIVSGLTAGAVKG
ncbi:MAG: carbohydrate ABC transporter permease [Gemmatimonadales bacterium]